MDESNVNEVLWRVPGFAKALGVTEACVRRWLLTRQLAYIKLGRLIRIPDSERRRLLEEGFHPRGDRR